MTIIAISAKKRCGKDEFAKTLIASNPGKYKAYALAGPIKRGLAKALEPYRAFVNGYALYRGYTLDDVEGFTDVDREEIIQYMDAKMAYRVLVDSFVYIASNIDKRIWDRLDEIKQRIGYIVSLPERENTWSIRTLMQTVGTDVGVYVYKDIWIDIFSDVYNSEKHDNITFIVTDCRQDHEMDMMRNMGAYVIHIDRPGFSDVVSDTHITEKGLVRKSDDIVISNDGTLEDFRNKILNLF